MIEFICDYCKTKCKRSNWEFKKSINHFCSKNCAKSFINVISAEMPKEGDKKFKLTFLSSEFIKNRTYFICKCDCGNITKIQRNKFGITQSCGDRQNHKGSEHILFKGYEEISKTYWKSIVHGAKSRNLSFNIKIEDVWNLFLKQDKKCALSGITINLDKNNNKEITASLDRIDSSIGYEINNLQWVHKKLNKIKMDLSDKEFIDWCTKVANNLGICEKLDFDDVLILPTKSNIKSRNDVNLNIHNLFNFPNSIPIIAANFDTVGSFSMAKSLNKLGVMTCLHKHYSVEEYINFFKNENKENVFYSVGASNKDIEKLRQVYENCGINNICLDVANAYIPQVFDNILNIKKIISNPTLMVGNIATPELIEDFNKVGVNIVKCGIGSGGVCTTRLIAGIGVPQLSCILDCFKETQKFNMAICSDGGCRTPADIVKAFAAGASMVMIGSMLSGHEECDGEWELDEHGNKINLVFYGMSSKNAMHKHYGEVSEYRASEGRCVRSNYKGFVKDTINEILGGLRSACSYVGASTLKDLPNRTKFIRCNRTHNHI